ncbi:peptidoglycan recognition protein family protein [Sporosarcina sp. CAU 1771]
MKIKEELIPKGNGNRPGNLMKPLYITIHNTGNSRKGATAQMHARFVKNPSTAVSWHFTVDDENVIYQHLPLNENGWHAGDGKNGIGNRKSIGIEICEYEGINEGKANDNAVWLIRKLMKEHTIPIGNVVMHKHWSGKNCPRKLIPIWSDFIAKVLSGDDMELKQHVENSNFYSPTRKIFQEETKELFRLSRESGILSTNDHEKQLASGTMSLDDTVGLIATIVKRVYFSGK